MPFSAAARLSEGGGPGRAVKPEAGKGMRSEI